MTSRSAPPGKNPSGSWASWASWAELARLLAVWYRGAGLSIQAHHADDLAGQFRSWKDGDPGPDARMAVIETLNVMRADAFRRGAKSKDLDPQTSP